MAYSGTTAASSLANPPRQLLTAGFNALPASTGLSTAPAAPNGQGGGMWFYSSTNLTTDLIAAGFFSDGKTLGMRPGDIVMGVQFTSAGSSVTSFQGAITAISTAGAATMSSGALITSTFG